MSGTGDYISREAFLEKERRLYCQDCSRRKNSKGKIVYEIGDAPCRACGIGDVLDDLEDIPAADVRPVVRGKWKKEFRIIGGYAWYLCTCSRCGKTFKAFNSSYYCPNCGADMREESWWTNW